VLNAEDKHKVLVTVWPARGRPVTCAASAGTLGFSAIAAAQFVRNEMPGAAGRLARVQVDVACDERPGPLMAPVAPGLEGLAAQVAGKPVALPPARYLADEPRGSAFAAQLARALGLTPDDFFKRNPAVMRFRTVAFVERFRGGGALPVFRGNVLLRAPGRKALRSAAAAAESYLARSVRGDGRFVGERRATSDEETVNESMVHHAYALRLFRPGNGDRVRVRARAGTRTHLRSRLVTRGEMAWIEDARGASLGAAATAVLALVETESREDMDRARALGRFLVALQGPDGAFHYAWDRAAGRPSAETVHRAWPGQAILALLALAERDAANADAWRRAALLGVRYETGRNVLSEDTLDPWRLLALARAGRAFETSQPAAAKAAATVAFGLADDACARQVRASAAEPDLIGGVPEPKASLPRVELAAGLAEAVAEAHRLARARGDAKRTAKYASFVRLAARFIYGQQYRRDNVFVARDDVRLVGGVRATPVHLAVHLDTTARALAAFRAAAALDE